MSEIEPHHTIPDAVYGCRSARCCETQDDARACGSGGRRTQYTTQFMHQLRDVSLPYDALPGIIEQVLHDFVVATNPQRIEKSDDGREVLPSAWRG